MDKLFGESFDEYVHKQVNTRQASLAKHQKDVADLQVFNSSTPWVRLTSSIKIDAQRTKELATNLELSADKIEWIPKTSPGKYNMLYKKAIRST